MARRGDAKRGTLTDYEAEQVEQIAAWKSLPPNPLSELWRAVVGVGANLVEKVIPDRLAQAAIEKVDDAAAVMAGQEDIKRQAGVRDLSELRDRPLEECDRMARQTGRAAVMLGTAEGAATGAGGVWTTLLDVPLLFTLALRTIRKIGHCYGHPLEGDRGSALTLAVLVVALSGSLEMRRARLQRLREIEDLLIEETEEDLVVEEVLSFIFQLEVFEEVPGIGAISGAALNATFMKRVEVTARRVFQEKWLRDAGKVHDVEPAEAHPRMLAPGVSGALGRLAYSGIYSVSFAATLPVWAATAAVAPIGRAVVGGFRTEANGRRPALAPSS